MIMSFLKIPLTPTPWVHHAGFGRRSYDPKYREKNLFKIHITEQWGNRELIQAPISLVIISYMPIPLSASKRDRERMLSGEMMPVTRPDTTNLNKLTEDCLKGIVIKDDSYCISITGLKRYGKKPHTRVYIGEIKSSL